MTYEPGARIVDAARVSAELAESSGSAVSFCPVRNTRRERAWSIRLLNRNLTLAGPGGTVACAAGWLSIKIACAMAQPGRKHPAATRTTIKTMRRGIGVDPRLAAMALAQHNEAVHDPRPMSKPPPGVRADYRRFLPITTRWMDNDVFGHVNNVAYYSFFDTAITHFLVLNDILTWRGGDHLLMVAESGCRYHSEIAFPDRVTAGVRVGRLGNSSIRHEMGIFREDVDAASAEGYFVHVCVDAATRRPAPMPDRWRQVLESQVLKTGAYVKSTREG